MSTISNNDIAKAIYTASRDNKEGEFPTLYKQVTQFLARKRLLSQSKVILYKLDKIINKEEGRVSAKITSAEKLKNDFKNEVISFLKKHYSAKEVVMTEEIDSKLIGGLKIEVNDEIIDLSVQNKIKKLQEHLTRKI
jgi:F-type H+-transporting ATPase subunit delta